MAKAKKLPSGNWRCQVYDYTDMEGKRRYKSFTAESKKEAEYLAAEFLLNKNKRGKISERTFGEALDHYIEIRTSVLSPRTIVDYKRTRRIAIQELMDLRICDITQEIVQQAINEESKYHSPKTVRNTHGLIVAVLKQERPEFALHTRLPQRVRVDLYIPSDSEVKKLLEEIKGTELELPVMLAAFGPMRRGEICALESKHIKGNVVHVCQNMVLSEEGEWIIKSPKSYAGDRFIDYPDFVVEKWQGIKGRITSLNPDFITHRFGSALKKANLPHFRFHDLRHYSASIQHALGIPDQYIMQRGGWSSDNVLKSVYRHTLNDKNEEMTKRANEYFKNEFTDSNS